MASCPNHPFWNVVHAELQERKDIKTVRATGPKMISAAVEKYEEQQSKGRVSGTKNPVFIPDAESFYPFFDDGNVGATNMREKCNGKISTRQKAPCEALKVRHMVMPRTSSYLYC